MSIFGRQLALGCLYLAGGGLLFSVEARFVRRHANHAPCGSLSISPDALTYDLIYDIRRTMPNGWWLPLLFFVLAAVGLWLLRLNAASQGPQEFRNRAAGFFMLVFGAVCGAAALVAVLATDLTVRVKLSRGSYEVVEGTVTDFRPGDRGDHYDETWSVETPLGRRSYSYSPSTIRAGYDRTSPHGGRVQDGSRIRILDVGGRIARLEIAPSVSVPPN